MDVKQTLTRVYVVMHWVRDTEYSMDCIKPTLEDAYDYICNYELTEIDDEFKFMLISVSETDKRIDTTGCYNEMRGICYIPFSTYDTHNLFNCCGVSHKIIVPMIVS
jgi:hypothetical protein